MTRAKKMQGCAFLSVFAPRVPNFQRPLFPVWETDRGTWTLAGILVAKSVSGSPGHWAAISFCPLRHCQPRAAAFVFPTSPRLYFSDLSICISSNPCPVFAPLNCCDTPFPFSPGLSWQTVFPSQLRLLVQNQRSLFRNERFFDIPLSAPLIYLSPLDITVSPSCYVSAHPRAPAGLSTELSTCHKS